MSRDVQPFSNGLGGEGWRDEPKDHVTSPFMKPVALSRPQGVLLLKAV